MAPTIRFQAHEETSKAQIERSNNKNATSGTPMTMEAFVQALAVFGQNNQPRRKYQNQEQGMISEFKLSPLPFTGTIDPLEAKKWIIEIQKTISVISCTEQEKVTLQPICSKVMLMISRWWFNANMRRMLDPSPGRWLKMPSTTSISLRVFANRKREREREFIKLEQGNWTVAEYEAEFACLTKFAPGLVATEGRKD